MDKVKFKEVCAVVFQFVILFSLIGAGGYILKLNGEVNELILGILGGLIVGIGLDNISK